MEYIAAALEARGHDVTLADLRFASLERICAAHVRALWASRRCTRSRPTMCWRGTGVRAGRRITIVVGGHTAAAYPTPSRAGSDAVVTDDGEVVMPCVADALGRGETLKDVGGLCLHGTDGEHLHTAGDGGTFELDAVPLPARHHVDAWRHEYACLAHRPVWLIETARGCPYRCSFCSIWQLHARAVSARLNRSAVILQLLARGFVADDLFWHHPRGAWSWRVSSAPRESGSSGFSSRAA